MALQSCAIVGEAKRRKKSPSRRKPRLTGSDVVMMRTPEEVSLLQKRCGHDFCKLTRRSPSEGGAGASRSLTRADKAWGGKSHIQPES